MKREFMLGSVPVVIYGEESARVFLFVHGLHGCKEEAARFAAVAVPRGWQVLAMDLPEHGGRKDGKRLVPWDVIPELQSVLRYAGGRYATIAVHATSIGAWFSMHAFADARIEKCLFVSPLVDMPAMIRGMMAAAGVDRARLKREKEIQTDFGQTLSWDYLCFAEAHPARAFCPIPPFCTAGRTRRCRVRRSTALSRTTNVGSRSCRAVSTGSTLRRSLPPCGLLKRRHCRDRPCLAESCGGQPVAGNG